jgi:N-sulfoglucosamine sulfohydrolase
MKHITILFVVLRGIFAAAETISVPPPHILFLLSDDHSYPFLSTYGDPNVRTPILDRLAGEGTHFSFPSSRLVQ